MARAPQPDIAPALMQASRAQLAAMMTRLSARGFEGLTPAFSALIPLLDAEGIRATVLAHRTGVTKQAVSQMLRALEERDYVEQVPDPSDTRAKIVRLTKRGVALRKACAEVRQELQELAIKKIGGKSLAQLQRDLARLAAALTEASK